jgi:hypothetical protein
MTYYNPFSGTGSRFEHPSDLALLGSDGVVNCGADLADRARVGLNDIIVWHSNTLCLHPRISTDDVISTASLK